MTASEQTGIERWAPSDLKNAIVIWNTQAELADSWNTCDVFHGYDEWE
jgi:hypothetical protein